MQRWPRPAARENPVLHGRRRRDVLRQLPARQRARRGAARPRPRRPADAGLHADPHRRTQRQPRPGVLRRHQRLPRAAGAALPPHATRLRSAVGCALGDPAGVEAADQGRSQEPRRDDRLDAARRAAGSRPRRSTSCSSGCAPSRASTSSTCRTRCCSDSPSRSAAS